MSLKTNTKTFRELLDALSRAKPDQEKLKLLFQMKVLIEIDWEATKKRRDKKRRAYDKKTQIIKRALKQFLTALDKIYAKHGELGDTAVSDEESGCVLQKRVFAEGA